MFLKQRNKTLLNLKKKSFNKLRFERSDEDYMLTNVFVKLTLSQKNIKMGVTNIKKKFFSTDFDNLVTKVNNGIGLEIMQERR